MSSIERPSTPLGSPLWNPAAHDDQVDVHSGTSESTDRPQARYPVEDRNFLRDHLSSPSSFSASQEITVAVNQIVGVTNLEVDIYAPLSILLTAMSKSIYEALSAEDQGNIRALHKIGDHDDGHITFIDHHRVYPTHFPKDILGSVQDKPDLVGAYNISVSDPPRVLPHHRIEAIVEAKSLKKSGGRPQAASYAYRHHQARPDHPACYCLIAKPQWYQVIVSEPSGVISSERSSWADLSLLAAYIYSHYVPPVNHVLLDRTISWTHSDNDPYPTWKIECAGKTFTNGVFMSIGDPWRRRTTIFKVETEDMRKVALKDYFRHAKRRFKEEELLRHIHKDGKEDVPGMVRLLYAEEVPYGHGELTCGTEEKNTMRTRVRLVLWDLGVSLAEAKTVNQLLMAIYDALEVHRTILMERNVLHRDMSFYNILMYPEWQKVEGRQVMPNAPPLITDILQGLRPVSERLACCLLIDADNAALIEPTPAQQTPSNELEHRTGTPMFIARSVSLGKVFITNNSMRGSAMPELNENALELYLKAHGSDRYNRYPPETRDAPTQHGATPPSLRLEPFEVPRDKPFRHRAEHDVESVFWTMLYALLRVQPQSCPKDQYITPGLEAFWRELGSHEIDEKPLKGVDRRDALFAVTSDAWEDAFFPVMADIGQMLHQISHHVRSEYALWTGPLATDHLHEAVQRLILQYLVDHKEHDIELDPSHRRSVQEESNEDLSTGSTRLTQEASRCGTSCRPRTTALSRSKRRDTSSASSSLKRRSETQEGAGPSRRAKCRKRSSGSQHATQESDDDGA